MSHIFNGQYPYNRWARDFPNVSFPIPRNGQDFPEHDIYWVHDTPRPVPTVDYDPAEGMPIEGQPKQVAGQWLQTWTIVDLPVPSQCTRRQGRLALLQLDKLQAVESAIAAITDPTERMIAQVEYEADTWEYDNQFLRSMWAQLGGTEQELKALFRVAVTK